MKLKLYCMLMAVICFSNYLFSQNTFPSSGKVGIGTTAPNASSLLEVASTTKGILIPRMTQAQRNAIATPATGLMIYQTDNNPGFFYYTGANWIGLAPKNKTWNVTGNSGLDSSSNFIGATDKVAFSIRTNNTERLHVSSTGNIGIGTVSPGAKLNVDAGTNLSLTNPGYFQIGNTTGYNLAFDMYNIQGRNNGSALSISLNPYGGSVYLGNQTGSYYGAVAAGYMYGLYSSTTDGTGVYGVSSTGSGIIGYASTSGGNNSRGVNAFGNYGVYATTYNNDTYYAGYFAGDVVTSGVYSGSDQKLKQNINDVSGAMNIIDQLHPKIYDFRQDGQYKLMNLPKGRHYGLIAQDVEKVLPNLVKNSKFDVSRAEQDAQPVTDPKNINPGIHAAETKPEEVMDFKAVNYTELIPVIIKGMQEQQQTIQQQQAMISTQQQQIDDLKKMVAALTANTLVTTPLSSASLQQNIPNPFSSATTIGYSLPASYSSASIIVTDAKGVVLKQINLNAKGKGNVQLDASTLASGAYRYSLYVDGKMIDSKQMISSK